MSTPSSPRSDAGDAKPDFPSCSHCGGWGLGLVTNPQRLCAHCARKTKAFFDPDQSTYCRDEGFVDISPFADGGVLKKVLKEGSSDKRIEEGCPTFVQYVGRLLDGSIFDTTRDMIDGKHVGGTDDPFEFQLGREKVIKGWDIGVSTMNVGEIARFIIKPEYAYGSQGFAPKVEPNETLDFEIELIRFGEPLPRFPTQAELAETRRKQHEEEKKMLEENPPPTNEERVATALEEKEKGNACVAKQDYEQAQKHYDSGFVHIFYGKDEWEHLVPQADKDKINQVKLLLYLNRSLCKIKLNKIEDALWDCDQAITLDPKNGKGHFRRGLVYIEKLKGELEKEKNGQFWMLEKGFEYSKEAETSLHKAVELIGSSDSKMARAAADLKRCHAVLAKYAAKYKEDEKKLYKEKIFDRMEAKNKVLQEKEKQKQMQEDFDDMPGLE
ncbi:hypothetical protein Poli38472_009156 [Pythium oligandrum]|uniref:peptidylprolyl isomerase n=1 Tax=Pythium oligandrum TaxID=41045 RepID=A0A8K1CK20_PYTOL|nr:hypothetical protein Poli38472_009156 [Pythium oligandrum]|eukprot:TMW64989.1 hypothetical protein Poli38472_009156 [Pythium oligandrum]